MVGMISFVLEKFVQISKYTRCSAIFNMHFTANLPMNLPVREKFREKFVRNMVENVREEIVVHVSSQLRRRGLVGGMQ